MAQGFSGLIPKIFSDWSKRKRNNNMEKKTRTYLSVSLTVQLIVCLSAGLSVFLSVHLIGYLSFCHSVCVLSEF